MITYPLNNIDYTAEDAELYFSTRESGVYDGNDFEVTVSGIDNDVTVGTGIAWIHNTKFSGKVAALKEPKTLTLSLPNSVYDRIDAIVIQFDANNNATDIIVKEGIASSSPVAPAVVRTESLYELHIFHVQRKAGATVISVDNLVDLRNDSNYCGIMFDPISSIDATLTKRGFVADAAETGKQIKRATNVRNLLVNSYFIDPVNQRGATSYTGDPVYTIDMWQIYDGTLFVNTAGYITYTGQVFQLIDGIDLTKTYTFAVGLVGGILCVSGKFSVGNTASMGNTKIVMTAYGDYGAVVLEPSEGYDVGGAYWAALYEGEYTAETLPPYVPKDESVEWLECTKHSRYFPEWTNIGSGWVAWDSSVAILIPHSHRMRVTPSFNGSIVGTLVVAGQWLSFSATPSQVVQHRHAIEIRFAAGTVSDIYKDQPCVLLLGNSSFTLDANL